jgi:hypothetical protein
MIAVNDFSCFGDESIACMHCGLQRMLHMCDERRDDINEYFASLLISLL